MKPHNSPLNRSFARRIGKNLSNTRKHLLETELKNHLFSIDQLLAISPTVNEVFLEIGFGMGEHFISLAAQNQDAFFIGAEAYLNGVANTLKMAKEHEITNFLIWPDDVDLI